MESKYLGRLVAFLAKMIVQQPLAAQLVSKGMLDPYRWRRLLDTSSPREVTMDALMIVLYLACMDKIDVLTLLRFVLYQNLDKRTKPKSFNYCLKMSNHARTSGLVLIQTDRADC
ncbi:hypothetical protein UlMin_005197 [Ulmus minor]